MKQVPPHLDEAGSKVDSRSEHDPDQRPRAGLPGWSRATRTVPLSRAEVRMATQEYRQEQSQVARFFAKSYQVAQRECEPISAADIYNNYKQWADKQGEYFKKSQASFGLELGRHLSQFKTVTKKQHGEKRQLCWFGVELLAESGSQGVMDDPQCEIPF